MESELTLIPDRRAMDRAILEGRPIREIARLYVMPNFPRLTLRGAEAKVRRYMKGDGRKVALKKENKLREEGVKESEEYAAMALDLFKRTQKYRSMAAKQGKFADVAALGDNATDHLRMYGEASGATQEKEQDPFAINLANVIVMPRAPGVPLKEGDKPIDID